MIVTPVIAYNAADAASTYMTAWSSGKLISDPMNLPPPPSSIEDIYATHKCMISSAATTYKGFGGGIGGYKIGAVGLVDDVPCLYAPLFQNFIYNYYDNDDNNNISSSSSSTPISPSISELNCFLLEAEIGFIIGQDLPPKKKKDKAGSHTSFVEPYSEDEVMSAVESVACCVELVGSRAVGDAFQNMPVMSKLADCVMAGGVLVGKPLLSAAAATRIDTDDNDNTGSKKLTTTTTFTSDSLRSIQTSFIVDGIKQGEGGCAKLCPQGGPVESVTWLVNALVQNKNNNDDNNSVFYLKKGQLVMSGMTSKLSGDKFTVDSDIEVIFDGLDGLAGTSVKFSFKE